MLRIRQGERLNGKGTFATHMQHLPARNQQFQVRADSQQIHQVWSGCYHVLKVIEHQEEALVSEKCLQVLERFQPGVLELEGVGNGMQDQSGLLQGSQGDKASAIGELLLEYVGEVQRQVCFADSSRTGEGQQAHLCTPQQRADFADLLFPPKKGGKWEGEGQDMLGATPP